MLFVNSLDKMDIKYDIPEWQGIYSNPSSHLQIVAVWTLHLVNSLSLLDNFVSWCLVAYLNRSKATVNKVLNNNDKEQEI